jgi:hypothetical protein
VYSALNSRTIEKKQEPPMVAWKRWEPGLLVKTPLAVPLLGHWFAPALLLLRGRTFNLSLIAS